MSVIIIVVVGLLESRNYLYSFAKIKERNICGIFAGPTKMIIQII